MSQQEQAPSAAAMPVQAPPPHVLLVAYPLQGHVNPLLRLGRRLASRGLLVTFTTFLFFPNAGALRSMPAHGACLHGVRFHYLDLDATGALDSLEDMLRHVTGAGPAALSGLVRRFQQPRPVTCVVNTTFVPWALDVAADLGVPRRATLWTQSCAVLSLYHHFYNNHNDSNSNASSVFPTAAEPDAQVALPGLPKMSMDELPLMVRPEHAHNAWGDALRAQLTETGIPGEAPPDSSPWVLVITFYALERPAIDALRTRTGMPVTPIGPLLDLEPDDAHDHAEAGITAWLDAHRPCSVVYVAFGSLVDIGRAEMSAMAEGLATTGRPFLWVVRERDDLHDLLLPSDSNGCKIVPWCAQGRVLRHASVGCFVTHCGWNSACEAMAAGVPMVCYPWWSDQFTNARFVAEEFRVGVRLQAPVTAHGLAACVEAVMGRGPDAAAIRDRAAAWKEEAAAAVAHGGSSDQSLRAFVDFLRSPVG
ncbi:UDP-glycosyltransferase 84A2 [Brachypodium distachyon]|uniref:Glycosyltransferase n=1 Tax=Brachypodium distachyon TaxID=15368 RepID=A0A0Q3ML40_BRADI|nr:UDP-glycosyltransferase 84A2 [Brachypodium distachyon]KQK05006.2 hypothetical protein BRADI_2g17320v3 [Brachypodium distachyon]|eukprot:XP_003565946.1 UDP-glycosyltransferase 84A2 [Brachypodium distachyon]